MWVRVLGTEYLVWHPPWSQPSAERDRHYASCGSKEQEEQTKTLQGSRSLVAHLSQSELSPKLIVKGPCVFLAYFHFKSSIVPPAIIEWQLLNQELSVHKNENPLLTPQSVRHKKRQTTMVAAVSHPAGANQACDDPQDCNQAKGTSKCALAGKCVDSCAAYGRVCPGAALAAGKAACEAVKKLRQNSIVFTYEPAMRQLVFAF